MRFPPDTDASDVIIIGANSSSNHLDVTEPSGNIQHLAVTGIGLRNGMYYLSTDPSNLALAVANNYISLNQTGNNTSQTTNYPISVDDGSLNEHYKYDATDTSGTLYVYDKGTGTGSISYLASTIGISAELGPSLNPIITQRFSDTKNQLYIYNIADGDSYLWSVDLSGTTADTSHGYLDLWLDVDGSSKFRLVYKGLDLQVGHHPPVPNAQSFLTYFSEQGELVEYQVPPTSHPYWDDGGASFQQIGETTVYKSTAQRLFLEPSPFFPPMDAPFTYCWGLTPSQWSDPCYNELNIYLDNSFSFQYIGAPPTGNIPSANPAYKLSYYNEYVLVDIPSTNIYSIPPNWSSVSGNYLHCKLTEMIPGGALPGITTAKQFAWGVATDNSNAGITNTINKNFVSGTMIMVVNARTPSDINNGATIYEVPVGTGQDPKKTLTKIYLDPNAIAPPPQHKNPPELSNNTVINLTPKQYITGSTDPSGRYFLPGKFPAGDYKGTPKLNIDTNKIEDNYPIILVQKVQDPIKVTMTADQCRFNWRLSHYTRSFNYTTDSTKNSIINQIAFSSGSALTYSAIDNSGLALGVALWSLEKTSGDDNSADVVPPLLATIDAVIFSDISNSTTGTNAASTIADDSQGNHISLKIYRNDTINWAERGTIDISRAVHVGVKNKNWPFFDAKTGGGQQLGIAGSSMGCSLPFLLNPEGSDKFNVMTLYDTLYSNKVKYNDRITDLSNSGYAYYADSDIQSLCDAYKLLFYRGNGFNSFSEWPQPDTAYLTLYADLIGSNAYGSNLRIRDINISQKDELAFGLKSDRQPLSSNDVRSWVDVTEAGTKYIPTFFPIYALPDSGWGAITVEIFSYQGIAAVIRNDYDFFCRWHRCFYYLLFLQNGGNMFNFNITPDISDAIYKTSTNTGGTPTPVPIVDASALYWVPSYLQYCKNEQQWYGRKAFVNKNYTVFNTNIPHRPSIAGWPVDTNTDISGDSETHAPLDASNITQIYANRWDPYRGQGLKYTNSRRVQWSTPSYTMGYSPVWVAGGKTDVSVNCYPYLPHVPPGHSVTDDHPLYEQDMSASYARPIAEVLNPYYSSEAGLYSASDGDQNIYMAYKLASLKWVNPPPITGTGPIFGTPYDCDVADFSGVKSAYNALPYYKTQGVNPGSYQGPPGTGISGENVPPRVITEVSFSLLNIIGYGYDGLDPLPTHLRDPVTHIRGTTWTFIADAIQKTLVSQNGTGWDGDYGNFAKSGSITGKRLVTLGHDTGGCQIKVDYCDPRIYQINSQDMSNNNNVREQWRNILKDNIQVVQNATASLDSS